MERCKRGHSVPRFGVSVPEGLPSQDMEAATNFFIMKTESISEILSI